MLNNAVKMNHDGIIITQNDKIVYFNDQMNSILNITEKQERLDIQDVYSNSTDPLKKDI